MSVVTPARLPPSTSIFFTHSLSVCGAQPIFEEIDRIADHRDPYSPSLFKTIRTARSRTSAEYLFVVLFVIAPSYSGVGASDNPGAVQTITMLIVIERQEQPTFLYCKSKAARPLKKSQTMNVFVAVVSISIFCSQRLDKRNLLIIPNGFCWQI